MNSVLRRFKRRLGMTPLRQPLVRWRHRNIRPEDVLLASYPNSGNTWVKHLIVYLLTNEEHSWSGAKDVLIPPIGSADISTALRVNGGRLLKTHEQYRHDYRRAIYLVRDARDVVISNYWFLKRQYALDLPLDEFVEEFLFGRAFSYGAWHDHVRSWTRSREGSEVLVVRYEDLLSHSIRELRKICMFLQIDVSDNQLEKAIDLNSFDAMKQRGEQARFKSATEKSTEVPFMRKGTSGQWRELFTKTQLQRFCSVVGDVLNDLGYEV